MPVHAYFKTEKITMVIQPHGCSICKEIIPNPTLRRIRKREEIPPPLYGSKEKRGFFYSTHQLSMMGLYYKPCAYRRRYKTKASFIMMKSGYRAGETYLNSEQEGK